jgi:MarR family transcriptional regulator for hemolysin
VQVVRARVLAGVSDVNLATTLRTFAAFEAALEAASPGQGS